MQQAIKELDYVPNSAAANLRSQQSNLVGLILRDITDPFYTEVTAGVSEVLEQQGYLLFLTQCGHSPERLQQSIQSLSRQGWRASSSTRCAAPPQAAGEPARLGAAAGVRRPLLLSGRRGLYRPGQHPRRPAGHHLSHRAGPPPYRLRRRAGRFLTRAERIGGYCASLLQYGLPFKPEWVLECERTQRSAADTIAQLLHRHPKVTAVLCHYPEVALGAIYGVEASGRSVGKDNYVGQQVALLGFDDVAEAELTFPALTFVSSPARDIYRQAALRLLTRLQQPELAPNRHLIIPSLQKRASACWLGGKPLHFSCALIQRL